MKDVQLLSPCGFYKPVEFLESLRIRPVLIGLCFVRAAGRTRVEALQQPPRCRTGAAFSSLPTPFALSVRLDRLAWRHSIQVLLRHKDGKITGSSETP